ncbi:hypothetical protein L249_8191 [Ophiocordyceps polyrhachis-furcata BCC 54312]|uniref:Uncharacterized protein n=1 Tax=Ophiocordyceps polyrhachis-furcata BCC 54312 TaxID=1330021 RepID=A0A367LHX3_9HYPO|nr:hypothetical protein L249_8191 [Ophiocordyceps polyrhachis-furcata BCC 54312]
MQYSCPRGSHVESEMGLEQGEHHEAMSRRGGKRREEKRSERGPYAAVTCANFWPLSLWPMTVHIYDPTTANECHARTQRCVFRRRPDTCIGTCMNPWTESFFIHFRPSATPPVKEVRQHFRSLLGEYIQDIIYVEAPDKKSLPPLYVQWYIYDIYNTCYGMHIGQLLFV